MDNNKSSNIDNADANEFIKTMEPPFNAILIGCTGSGKTCFLKYLWKIHLKSKFDFGIVICSTNELNSAYNGLVDESFIHTVKRDEKGNVDPNDFSAFENVFELCKQINAEGKKPRAFIIVDDMIGSLNFRNDTFVRYMATCRHYGISIFVLMQQLTYFLPPGVRENCKYIGIFKIRDTSVKKTYEYMGNKFKNKKEYADFMGSRPHYTALLLYPDPKKWDDKIVLIKTPLVE